MKTKLRILLTLLLISHHSATIAQSQNSSASEGDDSTLTNIRSEPLKSIFDDLPNGQVAIGKDSDSTWSVALGDLDNDGDLDVVVANLSTKSKVYLNDGEDPPFSIINVGTEFGSGALIVELGDIDNDSYLDIVLVYRDRVHYYLNNRTSLPFSPDTIGIPIGVDLDWVLSLAIVDINDDGDLEIVAGTDGQNVLFLNDGDSIPFDSAGNGVPIGENDFDQTTSVSLGDMDGDGDLDVITGNRGPRDPDTGEFGGELNKLYLNSGDASPFSGIAQGIPIGRDDVDNTTSITVGDVDDDGDLDVVAGNYDAPNKTYLNNGTSLPFEDIIHGEPVGGSEVEFTSKIVLGDVNNNGLLDLVAGSFNYINKIYLNNGSSSPFDNTAIGTPISLDIDGTRDIELVDMDNDGDLDLLTANSDYVGSPFGLIPVGGHNKIYLNDGSLTPFEDLPHNSVGTSDLDSTLAIALGDIDGDNDLDIVVGNDKEEPNKFYLNDGSNRPFAKIATGVPIEPYHASSLRLIDIDGDNDLDGVSSTALYMNDGSTNPFDDGPTSLFSISIIDFADLDNDGDQDIVSRNEHVIKYHLNDGDSNPFDSDTEGTVIVPRNVYLSTIALGDVDGDGDIDIVTGEWGDYSCVGLFEITCTTSGFRIKLYLNNGTAVPFDESTTPQFLDETLNFTNSIALEDLDLDGDLDIVAGRSPYTRYGSFNLSGGSRVYMNNGSTTPFSDSMLFGSEQLYHTGVVLKDINLDGYPDFIATVNDPNSTVINRLVYYLNNGSSTPFAADAEGTFIGSNRGSSILHTPPFALGDIDGDGDIDLVEGNYAAQNKIYFNNLFESQDDDGDGLSNNDEINIHGTDPFDSDSDDDGLNDGEEVLSFKTDPNHPDTDRDGYTDFEEINAGSDPLNSNEDPTNIAETTSSSIPETTSSNDSTCFIATAAYNTPLAQEIQTLRLYRDQHLLTNPLGQSFTDTYYRLSPPIADLITQNPTLAALTRTILTPLILLLNTQTKTITLLLTLIILITIHTTHKKQKNP